MSKNPVYPCTIVLERYGEWSAWNLYPEDVPEELYGGDVEYMNFYHECKLHECKLVYGKGKSPEEAYLNLIVKMNEFKKRQKK